MIQINREVLIMRDFEVRADGRLLGTIAAAPWRERASLKLGSETAEITREPWFGDFLLTRDRRPSLRAKPRGFWRRELHIDDGEHSYVLRRKWILSTRYLLLQDGQEIGHFKSFSTANIELDLREELPPELLLFAVSLATFLQSRTYVVIFLIVLVGYWLMP